MFDAFVRHYILDFLPGAYEIPACHAFSMPGFRLSARTRFTLADEEILPLPLMFWYATTFKKGHGYELATHCKSFALTEKGVTLKEALWYEDALNATCTQYSFFGEWHPIHDILSKLKKEDDEDTLEGNYFWLGLTFGIIQLEEIPPSGFNVLDSLEVDRLDAALPFLIRGDAKLIRHIQPNIYSAAALTLLLHYVDLSEIDHVEYNPRHDSFDEQQTRVMIEMAGWGDRLADETFSHHSCEESLVFLTTYHSYFSSSTLWCFLWNLLLCREELRHPKNSERFANLMIDFFQKGRMSTDDLYPWSIEGKKVTQESYIQMNHRDAGEVVLILPLLKAGNKDEIIQFLFTRKFV